MCKFFETDKPCPLGSRCHFAHGKKELRKVEDPLPQNAPLITASKLIQTLYKDVDNDANFNPVVINNYKTVICKYWEQGKCKFNQNCSFAHGDMEISTFIIYLYNIYIYVC